MRCDEAKEALIELVFGEPLNEDETEGSLNEHLLSCAACREEEKALLRLRDSLCGECVESPAGRELRERIRGRLPARKRLGMATLLVRPIPVYAAAAACVLAVIFARAIPPTGPGRPESTRPTRVLVDPSSPDFVVAGSYETSVGRHGIEREMDELPPSVPGGDSL